jgi:GNAT superfamily N-acetyltransferase
MERCFFQSVQYSKRDDESISSFSRGFWIHFRRKSSHFVGILGSEVVSTCKVAYAGNTITLFGMTVLENHRRKGIGAVMTLYPLHLARKRGYRFAVLGSSEIALPLYKKLGFREYCKIRNYSARFR